MFCNHWQVFFLTNCKIGGRGIKRGDPCLAGRGRPGIIYDAKGLVSGLGFQKRVTHRVLCLAVFWRGEERFGNLPAFLSGSLHQILECDGIVVVRHGFVAVVGVVCHVACVSHLAQKLVEGEFVVAVCGLDAGVEAQESCVVVARLVLLLQIDGAEFGSSAPFVSLMKSFMDLLPPLR